MPMPMKAGRLARIAAEISRLPAAPGCGDPGCADTGRGVAAGAGLPRSKGAGFAGGSPAGSAGCAISEAEAGVGGWDALCPVTKASSCSVTRGGRWGRALALGAAEIAGVGGIAAGAGCTGAKVRAALGGRPTTRSNLWKGTGSLCKRSRSAVALEGGDAPVGSGPWLKRGGRDTGTLPEHCEDRCPIATPPGKLADAERAVQLCSKEGVNSLKLTRSCGESPGPSVAISRMLSVR